jgi:hypothetical protein
MSSEICELRDRNLRDYRDYAAMTDPRQEMRDWLAAELAKHQHGVKGRLASFIGVSPSAIGRMLNTDPGKETREIKAHEFVKMQEFFRHLAETEPQPVQPPITDEAEVRSLLERIVGLNADDVLFVMKQIRSALADNGAEPLQTHPRDQSRSDSPPHESAPSRKQPQRSFS